MVRMLGCLGLLMVAGCSGQPAQTITLATTTSARDSGLLDVLTSNFRERTDIEVKVLAAGTGQALELARRGDADVLVTHAPQAEAKFVEEGYSAKRQPFMHNEFVLVGPAADPAAIKGEESIATALTQIAKTASLFVSRSDESGTHMKEQQIWQETGETHDGEWYLEASSGMAAALRLANENRAYTLTDHGTFLAQQDNLDLAILVEGDALLKNVYSVMAISRDKHPHVNSEAAAKFAEFLLSPDGQNSIEGFGVEKYGQPLFFPNSE